MLYAQKLALKNEVPLHVCFCRLPKFLDATIRHFDFIFKGSNNYIVLEYFSNFIIIFFSWIGLQEIEADCKKLDIEFHFLIGCGKDILPSFIEKHKLGALVIDFCPLRLPLSWTEELIKTMPKDVPLIQVRNS